MDTKSSAARRYACKAHINLLELLRVEKIVLPPVYISARVNILHGPDVESSNSLELYHSLYQDVICHGGDISFDIIQ